MAHPARKRQHLSYPGPAVGGMRAVGATTELVHLGHLQIKPCLGCFLCWVRPPGKCVQQDGAPACRFLDRFVQADLLVFGTPLYHYSVSGLMKNFIDRTLPTFEPWLVADPDHPGRSGHPDRYPRDRGRAAGLPCGFPELGHFAPLVQYFQFFAKSWRYLGKIRPGGEGFSGEQYQDSFAWYYSLVRQAGEQLTSAREGSRWWCRWIAGRPFSRRAGGLQERSQPLLERNHAQVRSDRQAARTGRMTGGCGGPLSIPQMT